MSGTAKTLLTVAKLFASKAVQARQDVFWGGVLEFLGLASMLTGPVMLKLAVDALSQIPGEVTLAAIYVSLFVLLWSLSAIFETTKLAFTDRITNLVDKHILKRVVRSQIATLANDSSKTASHVHGVLERLTYSLQTIIEGLLWKVLPMLLEVVAAAILIAMLMPLKYAFAMAIVLMAFFAFSFFSAARYERNAEVTNAAASRLSTALGDVLNNAQRVMFNGAIGQETDYLAKIATERVNVGWARSWLLTKAAIYQYGLLAIGIGALLLLGVHDISNSRISLGDFVLLQAYVFQFALPLGSFAFVLRQSGVALANVQEALDLIIDKTPVKQPPQCLLPGSAAVEIKDLSFRRDNDFELSDINLTIPKRGFIAIVGPNGAGKSTLMKLIAGVLSPSKGSVLIDGVNIQDVPAEERYKHALYVPQSVTLFDRTLRENILYHPCTLAEEEALVELEQLKFYENASVDLNLEVGTMGSRLSGGQVQKLELVRIAGIDSPVIVLDETTSGLDTQSDIQAIEMLRRRTQSRSSLVIITHRLANVEKANAVVFMKDGCVIATGTHKTLVAEVPTYNEFWKMASLNTSMPEHLGIV